MSEKVEMWCVECERQPDSICAAYKHKVEQKWPNGDPLRQVEYILNTAYDGADLNNSLVRLFDQKESA